MHSDEGFCAEIVFISSCDLTITCDFLLKLEPGVRERDCRHLVFVWHVRKLRTPQHTRSHWADMRKPLHSTAIIAAWQRPMRQAVVLTLEF